MIKSMTGFGRSRIVTEKWDVQAELHSVNHRFLEWSVRIPRAYSSLEEPVKALLKSAVSRGKLEVSLTLQNLDPQNRTVQIDQALAEQYISALRQQTERLQLSDDLSLSVLLRLPELFTVQKAQEEESEVLAAVKPAVEEALQQFLAMREREGQKLQEDLLRKLDTLESLIGQIEQRTPETVQQYYNRLYSRLQELLKDTAIEESRLVTEAGIFAEKIAVDEETVRLRSHIAQFRQLLQQTEPVGRKLDFLVQEMNREGNTIGSKAQDLLVTRYVVELKAELEKIREQIQNIE